jgi:hypothetical protein
VIYNVHNMSGMIQMNQKNPTTMFLNTTTVGTHSYNIIAEDKAGNNLTSPIDYNVTYHYVRVSPPQPLLSNKLNATEYKPGNNIVFSFRLLDATGRPQGAATAKIFVDGAPANRAGSKNLGNDFVYSPISKQYRFILSTIPLSTKIPHIVTIKIINDGMAYTSRIAASTLYNANPTGNVQQSSNALGNNSKILMNNTNASNPVFNTLGNSTLTKK